LILPSRPGGIKVLQGRVRENKEKEILINANIVDAAAKAVVASNAWIGSWRMKCLVVVLVIQVISLAG
jgi:hypothetical protein